MLHTPVMGQMGPCAALQACEAVPSPDQAADTSRQHQQHAFRKSTINLRQLSPATRIIHQSCQLAMAPKKPPIKAKSKAPAASKVGCPTPFNALLMAEQHPFCIILT